MPPKDVLSNSSTKTTFASCTSASSGIKLHLSQSHQLKSAEAQNAICNSSLTVFSTDNVIISSNHSLLNKHQCCCRNSGSVSSKSQCTMSCMILFIRSPEACWFDHTRTTLVDCRRLLLPTLNKAAIARQNQGHTSTLLCIWLSILADACSLWAYLARETPLLPTNNAP